MSMTSDELTALITGAVKDGMAELEAKTASAGSTIDDPLVKERIEQEVNAKVSAAMAEHEEKYALDLERKMAELAMVQPGAAKHAVDEVLTDKSFAFVGKPVHRCNELELEAQKLHDMLYMIGTLAAEPIQTAKAYLRSEGVSEEGIAKALDSYTSGSGSEWVETMFSSQFVERIALGGKLAPLFPRFTMAAKTVYVPAARGLLDAYLTTGSENAATTEDTTLDSAQLTFTAEDVNIYRAFSDNLDQDSVISVGGLIQAQMANSMNEWLDMIIDNGDITSTHHDSDISSGDPRKAWSGLREKALTTTTANASLATFNFDNLLAIPAAMSGYNDDPEKLTWIVPTKTYWASLFTLKDSSGNPVWLPANGVTGMNPIVSGQVGWLAGIPVVASGVLRTNLNASGAYDGITETKSALYCVYRDAWWLGDRKQVTIESARDVKTRSTDVVLTWRGDFQHVFTSTDLTTAMGYNY